MPEVRTLQARELMPFDCFDEGRLARFINYEYGPRFDIYTGETVVDPVTVEVGVCRAALRSDGLVEGQWENMELLHFAGDDEVTVIRGMQPIGAEAAMAESRRLRPDVQWLAFPPAR